MIRLKKEIEEFKLECEWMQMIPTERVISHIDIWLKKLEDLDEGKRAKFAKLLDDKRKEYESIVGKKPFMGWDYAVIDSKIDEYVDIENEKKLKEVLKPIDLTVDVDKTLPPKKKVVWKKK